MTVMFIGKVRHCFHNSFGADGAHWWDPLFVVLPLQ